VADPQIVVCKRSDRDLKPMKLLKLNILVCLLLLVVPTVAQQQWYFSIDERHPAERTYLQNVRRVLVVNNALVQPEEFGHTVVTDGVGQDNIGVDLSRAIVYTLFSTTQTLENSGVVEVVELMEISQNKYSNYYSRSPLSQSRVQRLCSDYKVDALLALNQLVLYDVIESFLTEGDSYYAYLQAYAQSHWTVHFAENTSKSGMPLQFSFTQSDTLLWESSLYYTRAQCLKELPQRQEALLFLASELGTKVANSMAPSWKPSRRYIYEVEGLEIGLQAFRCQKWKEAIHHWQQVAADESNKGVKSSKGSKVDKKAAACAAANIAIAYELLGDYALACVYADKAYQLFGVWKTAYGRQQQVNIRYYREQVRAKMAREGAR
jgi:tetratricopeptide (TPR) repeat protein